MATNEAGKKIQSIAVRIAIAKRKAIKMVLDDLLYEIPDIIKSRTYDGISSKGGKFKELSPGYVKTRTKYKSNLSNLTSPGESNLTATGQMLKAIEGKKEDGKLVFRINDKQRNRELDGGGSNKTNNEIREYVEKRREFFELTKEEREELISKAAKIIQDEITRAIK